MSKKNQDDVLCNFKKIHNNTYIYDLVIYEKATKKVKIICKNHGIFEITPNSHLNGSGCTKCGYEKTRNAKTLSKEEFVKKANLIHNNKYIYDNVEYKGYESYILISCPKHGEFKQKVRKHLAGNSCKKCVSENNYVDFVYICKEKYKDYFYTYDKVDYKGMYSDVIITCVKHGDFTKKAVDFYHKNRLCPMCKINTKSNIETKWLDSLNIPYEYRNKYINFGKKIYCVDGIDEINKIVYEFYGDFFHGNPDIYKQNDINPLIKESYGELYNKTLQKENNIKKYGYTIISIWENDFKNQIKNNNKNE